MNPDKLSRWHLLAAAMALLAVGLYPSSSTASEGSSAEQRPRLSGQVLLCGVPARVDAVLLDAAASRSREVGRRSTDATGFFNIEAPRPGVWILRIETREPEASRILAQRLVPLFHFSVLPSLLLPGESCDAKLSQDWTALDASSWQSLDDGHRVALTGRVLSASDGKPVGGAWVWTTDTFVAAAPVAADGSYLLDVPKRGRFILQAGARAFLPMTLYARSDADEHPNKGPIFALTKAGFISALVTDERGNGVSASLEAAPQFHGQNGSAAQPMVRAQADPAGEALILVDPGADYELTAEASGYQPARTTATPASSPELARRDPRRLTLAPAVEASGRVLGENGAPLADAKVTLVAPEAGSEILRLLAGRPTRVDDELSTRTRDDGVFRYERVGPGRYSLVVVAQGYEPTVVAGVDVPSGAGPHDLGSVFLKVGARLSGRVVDGSGQPIEGASVSVSLLSADRRSAAALPTREVTDGEGAFTVEGLGAGQAVELTIQKDGYLPAVVPSVRVPAEEELRVQMTAAASLAGRVVNELGAPVPGATVKATPAASSGPLTRRLPSRGGLDDATTTGPDGKFHLDTMEPGAVELTVESDCCLPAFRRLQLSAGEDVESLDIRLETGRALQGRVIDSTGRPITDATVSARGKRTRSQADGTFRIDGLPAEKLVVTAGHSELGRVRTAFVRFPEQDVTLAFAPPARLTGRVVDTEGVPIAQARVDVQGEGVHPPPFLTTNRDGRFERKLQPGMYDLRATRSGYAPADSVSVALSPGETRPIELVLGTGLVVTGRLLGAERSQLATVSVYARSAQHRQRRGEIGMSGDFRIVGLFPGEWVLTAQTANGQRAQRTIRLQETRADTHVDLELGRDGKELRGTISLDGEPLAGAWVSVSSFQGVPLAHTLADSSGSFSIPGLTAERVQVDVSSPEGDVRTSRSADGFSTSDLRIEILTGRVGGIARDLADAAPIPRAEVLLEPLADSTLLARRVWTAPDGRFGPVRLPAGRYRCTVSHPGYTPQTTELDIIPDGTSELSFWLQGDPDTVLSHGGPSHGP